MEKSPEAKSILYITPDWKVRMKVVSKSSEKTAKIYATGWGYLSFKDESEGDKCWIKAFNDPTGKILMMCNDIKLRLDLLYKPAGNHPSFPHYIVIGSEEKGRFFVFSNYYEQRSIQDQLMKGRMYKESETLEFIRQMLVALIYAHKKDLVLRALSPDHIFVDGTEESPVYKVGGLEYMGIVDGEGYQDEYISTLSPLYIDPRNEGVGKMYTPASDVYILGLVACQMLTGKLFNQNDIQESVWQKTIEMVTLRQLLRKFLCVDSNPMSAEDIDHLNQAAFHDVKIEIRQKIHEGNNATVVKGLDLLNDKLGVYKIFPLSGPKDAKAFEHEKEVWSKFTYLPYVVKLVNYCEAKAKLGSQVRPIGALEAPEYECDLEDYIKRLSKSSDLSFDEVKRIAFDLALALYAMHADGFCHLDIKPKNAFPVVTKGKISHLLLSDFGTARETAILKDEFTKKVGTPCYMSPEMESGKPYTLKSDVWSYGVLLFFCIFKCTPSEMYRDNPALLQKCQKEGLVNWEYFDKLLAARDWDKSGLMMNYLKLCLTKDPAKRPTMEELLEQKLFKEMEVTFRTKVSLEPYQKARTPAGRMQRYKHKEKEYSILEYSLDNDELIKRYDGKQIEPEKVLYKYQRGVSMWIKCNNAKNIATYVDSFLIDNKGLVVVTEPFQNDLENYLKAFKGPGREETIIDFARDIANGLLAVHAAHIAHRALCPSAVYVTEQRGKSRAEAKVAGFLYAKWALRSSVSMCGYNLYDAPELLKSQHQTAELDIDTVGQEDAVKMDVWSYGMVLFYLMFGKHPYDCSLAVQIALANGKLVPPEGADKGSKLFALAGLCISLDPTKRPQIKDVLEWLGKT